MFYCFVLFCGRYFGGAFLFGTLPPVYSLLTAMAAIEGADSPLLSGSLPPSWSTMTGLQFMRFTGTAMRGAVPQSYSNFVQLVALELGDNALSGTLPSFFSVFHNLRRLALSANAFTGTIPPVSFQPATNTSNDYVMRSDKDVHILGMAHLAAWAIFTQEFDLVPYNLTASYCTSNGCIM
jgi:hypothetical protein